MQPVQKHRPAGLRRDIDMLHGSLWDKLLLFALPLAATGILQQLFNATDVAIVGRLVGSDAMAAVGSNAPVINLLVNLFLGISLGANVVISRCTGQGNPRAIRRGVHTALVIALTAGCFLAVFGILISRTILSFMGVPEEVFPMALLYLRIYLAGMPVVLLYNYESAIFRSQGDTRTPLLVLLVAGLSNVGLNVFFIRVFDMAADGVALATVLSNAISAFLMLALLRRAEGPTRVELRALRVDVPLLKQMLRIGVPAGVQSMVFSLSNVLIQSSVNSLGADAMAGSAAAYNLEVLVYFLVNAFGQACTTFTGQNIGAGQRDRCLRVLKLSLLIGALATALFSGMLFLLQVPLLSLFNTKEAVIAFGLTRLLYMLPFEHCNMCIEIFSGSLRGFGYSLPPALIALVGVCGVRILWVKTYFPTHRTLAALVMAYPISWSIAAGILILCYLLMFRKLYPASSSR